MVKANIDVPPKEGDPGGGGYNVLEKKMKRKKRKGMSDEKVVDDENLVPSAVDSSILVHVPKDSCVNVDNVLDKDVQNHIHEWLENDLNREVVGNGVAEVLSSLTVHLSNDVGVVAGGPNGGGTSIDGGSSKVSSINKKYSRKNKLKDHVAGEVPSSLKVLDGSLERTVIFNAGGAAAADSDAVPEKSNSYRKMNGHAAAEKSPAGMSFGEFEGLAGNGGKSNTTLKGHAAHKVSRPHAMQKGGSTFSGNGGSMFSGKGGSRIPGIGGSNRPGNGGKTNTESSRFALNNNNNASKGSIGRE